MERASTKLRLSNPLNLGIEPIEVSAIADTNTLMLCIPEHIAIQLDLQTQSTREVSVADGRRLSVPYVGPLRVDFENRFCFVGALVLGDEILLGAVPMEDMDLIVQPSLRKVTVDPSSPNVPHARVK
jgi:clan AA aspartic protease